MTCDVHLQLVTCRIEGDDALCKRMLPFEGLWFAVCGLWFGVWGFGFDFMVGD